MYAQHRVDVQVVGDPVEPVKSPKSFLINGINNIGGGLVWGKIVR